MRRLPPDPLSRRAVWAARLGWFASVVVAMGVLGIRFRMLAVWPGLVVIAAGLLVALLALLLALIGFRQIWVIGARGFGSALVGFLLALGLLVWPGIMLARAIDSPVVHDVTTDPLNPPEFGRSRAVLAARDGYVPPVAPAFVPDGLKPLLLDVPVDEAMPMLDEAIANLGWEVLDRQLPSRRGAPGRIEAIQRGLLLRLPDGITIRVTPLLDQTRIDIRSATRYGNSDFGANARRIRAFQAEVSSIARGR